MLKIWIDEELVTVLYVTRSPVPCLVVRRGSDGETFRVTIAEARATGLLWS
jgi:hypothetical protein